LSRVQQSSTAHSEMMVMHAPDRRFPRSDRDLPPAEAMRRAKADYVEMPGLSVTVEQGARLWQVETSVCLDVLADLVRQGFVFCVGGTYRRP
jgi:hypothetical protein